MCQIALSTVVRKLDFARTGVMPCLPGLLAKRWDSLTPPIPARSVV